MAQCACGSGHIYGRCCGPYHQGAPAPTAEALMRSRYSAFANGLVDYLVATTDPDGPQFVADEEAWRRDIARFCQTTRFVGLRVESHEPGDEVAHVRFAATLRTARGSTVMVERSRFVKKDGRWLYHSGDVAG